MLYETFWHDLGNIPEQEDRCEKCVHYRMIDSAYGYCVRFPPKLIIVKLIPLRRDYEYTVVTWNLPSCGEYINQIEASEDFDPNEYLNGE